MMKKLNLLDLVFINLSSMIGAGIFVVIGLVAKVAGDYFLYPFLFAGFLTLFLSFPFIFLSRRISAKGAEFEYLYATLPHSVAFSGTLLFVISILLGSASVATGLGCYLSSLFNIDEKILSIFVVLLACVVNYFGARAFSKVSSVVIFVTLLTLLYIIFLGLPHIKFVFPFPPDIAKVFAGTSLIFFAYTGFSSVVSFGEETDSPRKTIPLAIFLSVLLVMLIYFSVALSSFSLGKEVIANSKAPLVEVVKNKGISQLVLFGGICAMLTTLFALFARLPRILYAMSKRKEIPIFFEKENKYEVPINGLLFTAATVTIMILSGTLYSLVNMANFTTLLFFILVSLSAFPVAKGKEKFLLLLSIFSCLILIAGIKIEEIIFGSLAFLFLTLVYPFVKHARLII